MFGLGRRWVRAAVAVLVASLLLGGCGGGAGRSDKEAAGGGTAAPAAKGGESAAKAGQPVTLKVWIMPNSPQPDADLLEVLKPFLEQNKHIQVQVTVLDWGSAWTKITTAATSGEGPDVLQLGTTWVPAVAAMGALAPLTDRVAEIGGKDAYHPATWNTTGIAGKPDVYAVPWFVDARAVYYRTDVFQKAGVDPAVAFKDWDSFKAALKKIHGTEINGKKIAAIGFPGKNDWNVAHNLFPWIWGAGGSELTPDLKAGAFDSDAAVDGVMFYTGLAREGLVPRAVLEKNTAEAEGLFANGEFAVMIGGPWLVKSFRTPSDKGGLADSPAAKNVAVAPVPAGPKGRFTFFGGSNLAIFKNTKHFQEAWGLVKFLAGKEAQLAYARVSGMLPALKATWSDPSLTGDPMMKAFVEAAEYGRSYPSIPAWGPVEGVLVKHFGILWDMTTGASGTYSREAIKQELAAAVREVNELLKQQ